MVDIICLSSWRGVGGAQMNAALLADEFEKRGYSAELGFLFDREPTANLRSVKPFVVADNVPKNIREWFVFFWKIKVNVIDKKPRAIIGFHPFANVVGALVTLFLPNCIFIGTQRNPSESQSKKVAFLEKIAGAYIYKANICVTQSVAESYAQHPVKYRKKILVVHNGTPPLAKIVSNKEYNRSHFNMPKNAFILGCLGRLHSQKNITFALDVVSQHSNAILYLAGSGPLEFELRNKVIRLGLEERVFFLGSVHGEDISRFYDSIDVLLFPSLFEGFGRVLIEALSKGVVVLAHDIPVVKEVAGSSAILLPLSAPEWVAALNDVKDNSIKINNYSQKGIERSALFTVDTMVDKYLSVVGLTETKYE